MEKIQVNNVKTNCTNFILFYKIKWNKLRKMLVENIVSRRNILSYSGTCYTYLHDIWNFRVSLSLSIIHVRKAFVEYELTGNEYRK